MVFGVWLLILYSKLTWVWGMHWVRNSGFGGLAVCFMEVRCSEVFIVYVDLGICVKRFGCFEQGFVISYYGALCSGLGL